MKHAAITTGLLLLVHLSVFHLHADAQKRWDGGAGDGLWTSALNWSPDGVPTSGEDVLLDHALVSGPYTVILPTGTTSISVNSLSIFPAAGDSILVDIPPGDAATPALALGSPADALVLGPGAVLRNASGAPSGETILLAGSFRILDGGHYLHRTPRANAYLIDHLATDSATRHGLFEFDVPGSAGYTVSLTGNTFGDLRFSAAASGTKSYSGSGTTDLVVRGSLQVGLGAQLTSTLTANIRVGGDLDIEGILNLQPVTTGNSGRSLLLTGDTTKVKGNGAIAPGAHFRNMEAMSGATVFLQRDLLLSSVDQSFLVHAGATLSLGRHPISGAGAFHSESGATLRIGAAAGLTTGDSGNLRTAIRQLDPGMTYIYDGAGAQRTGDALPPSLSGLVVDKSGGELTLTRAVEASRLGLMNGLLFSTDSAMITIGADGTISSPDDYGRTDEGWSGAHILGPCRLRTTGIGTWRFPIGDGQRSAPIVLRRQHDGEVMYIAEYHHVPPPMPSGTPPSPLLDPVEYWTLSSSGGSPQHDAFLDLSWRRGEWPLLDSTGESTLRVSASDGSGLRWSTGGTRSIVSIAGPGGWVSSDAALSTFTAFTLAMAAPTVVLDLQGSLHCQEKENGNLLTWEGQTLAGRELRWERSVDGMHFSSIPSGPSGQGTMLDDSPSPGQNWYRLVISREGSPTTYSNACLVMREGKGRWKITPQPMRDHFRIEAPGPVHGVRFRLMELSGQLVREGALTDGAGWDIRLEHPVRGPLVLQVTHAQGSFTTLLLRQ